MKKELGLLDTVETGETILEGTYVAPEDIYISVHETFDNLKGVVEINIRQPVPIHCEEYRQ